MAEAAVLERALRRILWELSEYLPEMVLIGGWVPLLYRQFGGFKTWRGRESLTLEVDMLTPPRLPARGRAGLVERLRGAGFEPLDRSAPSAVWAAEPETGEKVEFFIDHAGPAKTRGSVQPIAEQPGLGGISLDGLWLLAEYSCSLTVPAEGPSGDSALVELNVPRLGAFLSNKAFTIGRRPGAATGSDEPKMGKDILYLRDLMAAGPEVVQKIESEIQDIHTGGVAERHYICTAASNLRLLGSGQWFAAMRGAARMLMERGEHGDEEPALFDLKGYLADALDSIEQSTNEAASLNDELSDD